jgi:hypothetical protein
MGTGTGNTFFQLTGSVSLNAGANLFTIGSDDGAVLTIADIGTVWSSPNPHGEDILPFTVNAPSAGTYGFTLDCVECCGATAGLQLVRAPGPTPGAGFSSLVVLVLAGALTRGRSFLAG